MKTYWVHLIARRETDRWMDRRVFVEFLSETRAVPQEQTPHTQVLFCDNASGHKETPLVHEQLTKLNMVLKTLSANSTDLTQPLDYFIIAQFKKFRRVSWDKKSLLV